MPVCELEAVVPGYHAGHRAAQPLPHAEADRPRLSVDRGTAEPLDQHRRKA